MPILPSDYLSHAEVSESSPIFAERLEPWAAEFIGSLDNRNVTPRVMAFLIEQADADGVAAATYRDLTLACDIGQAAACRSLHRLTDRGLIEKLRVKNNEPGLFRILCLKGGA